MPRYVDTFVEEEEILLHEAIDAYRSAGEVYLSKDSKLSAMLEDMNVVEAQDEANLR